MTSTYLHAYSGREEKEEKKSHFGDRPLLNPNIIIIIVIIIIIIIIIIVIIVIMVNIIIIVIIIIIIKI